MSVTIRVVLFTGFSLAAASAFAQSFQQDSVAAHGTTGVLIGTFEKNGEDTVHVATAAVGGWFDIGTKKWQLDLDISRSRPLREHGKGCPYGSCDENNPGRK